MMVPQVIKTVGYTNFSPFIPIPSPIIAPTAGTLTAINPIVINNFIIITSSIAFLAERDFSKSQFHSRTASITSDAKKLTRQAAALLADW